MDNFESGYEEFIRLWRDLEVENERFGRQLRALMTKWPDAYTEHAKFNPPTDKEAKDFPMRHKAWMAYKLLSFNYTNWLLLTIACAAVLLGHQLPELSRIVARKRCWIFML